MSLPKPITSCQGVCVWGGGVGGGGGGGGGGWDMYVCRGVCGGVRGGVWSGHMYVCSSLCVCVCVCLCVCGTCFLCARPGICCGVIIVFPGIWIEQVCLFGFLFICGDEQDHSTLCVCVLCCFFCLACYLE